MRSTDRTDVARDERGGAQVEGAIVALFLAMMFGAFLWMQRVTHVELSTVRDAGREVWRPAVDGCESGPPAPAQAWVGGYRTVQARLSPAASSRLGEVRQDGVSTSASRTASRPAAFGGGSFDVSRGAGTECNTDMQSGAIDWSERVREIFCADYPADMRWPEGCTAP